MRRKGSATGLLGDVIELIGRCLTPASAREVLSLRSDPAASRRIERLAAECNAGTLSPEERAEYRLFVEAGDLVAILQAQARRCLAKHPDP